MSHRDKTTHKIRIGSQRTYYKISCMATVNDAFALNSFGIVAFLLVQSHRLGRNDVIVVIYSLLLSNQNLC